MCRRRRYQLMAGASLGAGLAMLVTGGPQAIVVGELLLAILCAVVSLRSSGSVAAE